MVLLFWNMEIEDKNGTQEKKRDRKLGLLK